jgi:hypothetical protein
MPKKTRKVESQNRLKISFKIDAKNDIYNLLNLFTYNHFFIKIIL